MEQAGLYGRAQWQAATKKFDAVAKILTEIADMGKESTAYLAKGIKVRDNSEAYE